jgi:hypothetical protein
MAIMRTYHCPECNHRIEVTLTAEEWDKPPPSCAACDRREMDQEFKPPAIGGSVGGRARAIAENIIANDYQVANFQSDRRLGGTPKVRYKDQTASVLPASWQAAESHKAVLETAISIGKANRGRDGLDILRANLASGVQPDLIEASKRRAIKVW